MILQRTSITIFYVLACIASSHSGLQTHKGTNNCEMTQKDCYYSGSSYFGNTTFFNISIISCGLNESEGYLVNMFNLHMNFFVFYCQYQTVAKDMLFKRQMCLRLHDLTS